MAPASWAREIVQLSVITNTSDIDGGPVESTLCDKNADCTNSDGSYSCTCKDGFTGDGTTEFVELNLFFTHTHDRPKHIHVCITDIWLVSFLVFLVF